MKDLAPVWDLESIFPGGSGSAALEAWLEQLAADIADLKEAAFTGKNAAQWRQLIETIQDIAARLRQAAAFVFCLNARDVKDDKAKLLNGRLQQLEASLNSVMTALDEQLLGINDADWRRLLETPGLAPLAFPLDERRTNAREKMPAEQEKLANDLAVDGYHGWSNLYDLIAGRISIPWVRDGRETVLSVGQAFNVLADPDPAVRAAMAAKWEQAWGSEAELCAAALNHLGGFRLNLYRHRGWESIHKEPLVYNRMSAETLNVMWETVEKNKEVFVRYLERKKRLLGLAEMSWFDVGAPLGNVDKKYTFEQACSFVVEQFALISPRMADFCAGAFRKRWVEAEDRPGKRAGAFCSPFPVSKETRVFMTFAGTPANVSTLAHEMGHAFHQHVLTDLPYLAQRYAMNVAETASTFTELAVADGAFKNAATREEKIALLDDKLRRSVAFFMDIHARFLFETAFYERRRGGPVGVDELNRLMLDAQIKAFRNGLDQWQPYFWCSKLHFYITLVPFYNFPYTFGYLFSAGIYALAREASAGFEERYINLLRDTGRMRVEDLAARHLGVDLTGPAFWQQAMDIATADAREFLRLTD
jgi:oligoendopeptidase F